MNSDTTATMTAMAMAMRPMTLATLAADSAAVATPVAVATASEAPEMAVAAARKAMLMPLPTQYTPVASCTAMAPAAPMKEPRPAWMAVWLKVAAAQSRQATTGPSRLMRAARSFRW